MPSPYLFTPVGAGGGSSSTTLAITTKTTTYTALTTDDVILVDTSGGAWTLTLYAAAGNVGKVLRIKKTTNDFSLCTIDGNSSETIDGSATTTLATQYEEVCLLCDGSNWLVLDRCIPNTVSSYTPSGSFVTNTTYSGKWSRVGRFAEIQIKVAASGGVGTPGALTASIPSGLTIDTADITGTTNQNFGSHVGSVNPATSASYPCASNYTSTTSVRFLCLQGASSNNNWDVVTHAVPATWANGGEMVITFRVPIVGWAG